MHRDKLLTIKPTRCTSLSNLFLKWNSTCFGQFLCASLGIFHCTHSNIYRSADSLWAGANAPAHKLSANLYDIYHCCVYSEQTPDDGQRNCPKHVEFHSRNKFEKLVHLVGFIVSKLTSNFSCTGVYPAWACKDSPFIVTHRISWYDITWNSQN